MLTYIIGRDQSVRGVCTAVIRLLLRKLIKLLLLMISD